MANNFKFNILKWHLQIPLIFCKYCEIFNYRPLQFCYITEHLKKLAPSGLYVQRDFNCFTTKPGVLPLYFSKYLFLSNLYATLLKFCSAVCKLIQFHPEQNYVSHQNKNKCIHLDSEGNISMQFLIFILIKHKSLTPTIPYITFHIVHLIESYPFNFYKPGKPYNSSRRLLELVN